MRLWTLHPRHLDGAGLVALWREALLAQAVLRGRTRGYKNHPALARFRAQAGPVAAIAAYLRVIRQEAAARGYAFKASLIARAPRLSHRIPETRGQILYEWAHLSRKLRRRNPAWHAAHHCGQTPSPHPLFRIVPGRVGSWERLPGIRAEKLPAARKRVGTRSERSRVRRPEPHPWGEVPDGNG